MFKRYIHELYPSVVFEQVSKDMLKTYLQHISTYKPKTVKRKLASLKALFNYYDFEHDDFLNPFRKLRIRFKEPYVLPVSYTHLTLPTNPRVRRQRQMCIRDRR